MHDFSHLKHMVGNELEEFKKRGRLTGGDLGSVHMLSDIYKNLCKIEMLEDGGSSQGGSYDSSGRHYVRGHYSRDGGSYDEGSYGGSYGGSYDGSYDGSYRGYSRDEAKGRMMNELEEMMHRADPQSREALKRCMQQLQNG